VNGYFVCYPVDLIGSVWIATTNTSSSSSINHQSW